MRPIKSEAYKDFPQAKWFEKVATLSLVIGIIIIGLTPLWLSDMIRNSLGVIVEKLALK
jgi:NADH-quinone oxidoreductase subunit M